MASGNRGHHKVPKTYLQAFTDSKGFVWVLDRNYKLYPQKPKEIFTERDYYTIKFETGGGSLDIETKFLGGIEGKYTIIYKNKIEKQLPITTEEKAQLAIFVTSMMERQSGKRDSLEKFFKDIKEHYDHMINLPEENKRILASMPRSKGRSIPVEDLLKAGKDVGSFHTSLIPSTVEFAAPIIFKMKWAFLVYQSGKPLITSDNPCVLANPELERIYGKGAFYSSPGLAQKSVEISLPLSPKIALLCGWKLDFDCMYIPVEEKYIVDINHRTMRHANSLASSDKEILEEILKFTKEKNLSKTKDMKS